MSNSILGNVVIPNEAVQAWQSMANEISTAQCTFKYKNKSVKTDGLYSCSTQGQLVKCELTQNDKDGVSERVFIQNERGFVLLKSDSGRWRLVDIKDPGVEVPHLKNALYFLKVGYSLHGSVNLLDIPGNGRFRVESWRVLVDRDNFVELRVRDNMVNANFTLILQPEKRYRVVEWSAIDDGDPDIARRSFEYADDSVYGDVVPLKQTEEGEEWVCEMISLSHNTLPEEEFQLSFYGLPDYVEPSRTRNYWIWMFLVAVVVTLVVFWKTR